MIFTREVEATNNEELKKEVSIPLRMWTLFPPLLLIILLHLNDLYMMIKYRIKSGKFVFKYDYMVFKELKMEAPTQSDTRHRSKLKKWNPLSTSSSPTVRPLSLNSLSSMPVVPVPRTTDSTKLNTQQQTSTDKKEDTFHSDKISLSTPQKNQNQQSLFQHLLYLAETWIWLPLFGRDGVFGVNGKFFETFLQQITVNVNRP